MYKGSEDKDSKPVPSTALEIRNREAITQIKPAMRKSASNEDLGQCVRGNAVAWSDQ